MKNIKLKVAILGIFGIASAPVFAAGTLCALAAAPTGSAYIDAYNSGRVIPPLAGPATTALNARMNFGTTTDGGSAGNCEITALANDSTTPVAGYTLVVSASRTVPTTTGGSGNIGTVTDRIWRNAAGTSCIFGTKFTAANADHDSGTAGTQYFEVNDIARGGFGGLGTVNVGYFKQATNASRLYRVGRTNTSVQHRAYKYGAGATLAEQQNNGTGYVDLPPIGGPLLLDINGVNAGITAGTVATIGALPTTLQDAQVNDNWVDFTSDNGFQDDDGGTNVVSSMTYVEAACNNDPLATIQSTWVKAGAISLRQTAQENTTFKTIDISGYAPPGAVIP